MTTVAVLGGGVAGLTAAHELAERGFQVTVYEALQDFGGKARSMPGPDLVTGDRKRLPGEHGFRFFPGFYRHIPDTMKRIPHGNGTVVDHLVETTRIMIAQDERRDEIFAIAKRPASPDDVSAAITFLRKLASDAKVPPEEIAFFVNRLLTLLCSCDARRFQQWENTSWWDFVDAKNKSDAYQKFLAVGMTRTLVAAKAEKMSSRTGGLILWQLIFDMIRGDGVVDRVLDGPTSDVWIDPWLEHLKSLGVQFRSATTLAGIACDSHRITGVTVTNADGTSEEVKANHYIAALPVEDLLLLLSPALLAADPSLAKLHRLETAWMNGLMFYLEKDVEVVNGHALFVDSEWALTAISQAQFWKDYDFSGRGDGRVNGILSVDISDWTSPGRRHRLAASKCTRQQIVEEVWEQIVDHIDDGSLSEANVITTFLDPAITFTNPSAAANAEPLLINTKGSWHDRPQAKTKIANLYLASDFVQTNTDLATMEGANEAARNAVNAILDSTNSVQKRCETWKLEEPSLLSAARKIDELRWALGQAPVAPPFNLTLDGLIEVSTPVVDQVLGFIRRFV